MVKTILRARILWNICIIFLFLIFWGAHGNLCWAGWTGDMESIRKAAGNIKTFYADFIQEKRLPILIKPIQSKGRIYYQPPDSLRWEYTGPIKNVMMTCNGEGKYFIWSKDRWIPDLRRRIVSQEIILSEVGRWLNGQYIDQSNFSVELLLDPEVHIVLKPKQNLKQFVHRIELTFDKTPGVIKTVEVLESNDASTRIDFINFKVNKALPPSIFKKP